MLFNTDKCKTVSISRKKSTDGATYYTGGTALENDKSVKDLGITVFDYLNWRQHITFQANRHLGRIKRPCENFKDVDTRRTLYYSLVLPQLEFSSQLWSPSQINHKLLLENVQRRATKFILNYPEDMSYK